MKVSLTDICDFQGGTQPPKDEWIDQPAQGYVRMLQIRDFTQSGKNYIEYVKDTGKLKTCIEDDILIGRYGASIGKILTGLAGAYNVAIVKTIPDEKVVNKKYLYWYLNSQYFQRFISNVGSRAAQAGFNKNDLGAAQIPLVDKERQEEICEVLEKANKLISLRKQQLAKLDELVKARFVEMFGDPIRNEKGWNTYTLAEMCDGIGDGLHGTPEYDENGEYPFINGNNLISGIIQINPSTKKVNKKTYEKHYIKISQNAILLSINGTLGRIAFYNSEQVMLGKSACYCNLRDEVNRIFVYNIMKTDAFARYLEDNATKSTIKNVGLKAIREYRLIMPPIPLQNQFSSFVERVDQQKQTVQQSLEKLEFMKKALMQEFFG